MKVDLAAMADAMDDAADTVSTASTRLIEPMTAPVSPRVVDAVGRLWRLEGQLRGMADALRMVEVNADD